MYPEQNLANARIPIGGSNIAPTPPDTLSNRLANVQDALMDVESVILRMRVRVFGPTPDGKADTANDSGVNAQVMDIRTRTLRIRDAISDLDTFLA